MSYNRYGSSFWKGLLAGIPFGIGIATGIEPTKEGVSDFIAQNFCSVTQGWGTGLNCDLFFLFMMLISLGVTGWHLYSDIFESHSYDRMITFMIYLLGGLITTLIMLVLLK